MAENSQKPRIFSLVLFLCFTSIVSDLCNPQDKEILLKIKKAFKNPYVLASWNPKIDCCEWYTVTCDPISNRIDSLTIFSGNDLSGHIPPEVGDLPYLKTLEFHKQPNLTGPIQPAIAKLHRLTILRLSWTNLSGSVPSFLGNLTNLTFLDLSFNQFTGTIPSSLSLLPKLDALHLDRNKLTGQIPNSFGYFAGQVPSLYLSHNQLSGEIPASLSRMNFNSIDLSRNKLEGDASMIFGANKTTQFVDLSRNSFDFDLTKVVFPASLTNLDINHNKITGSIPAQMTKLELQFLNVSYNRLCGQIPVGGKLQSFDYSSYFHNKCLCGSPLDSCKKSEMKV